MNKTEIEFHFDSLINISPDSDFKAYFKKMKDGVLEHIAKLEEENKIQQEIMDQQTKLIMEKG